MSIGSFSPLLFPLYGPLFLLFLLCALNQMGARQQRRKRDRLASSRLAEIDVMDGRTFERYLHARFTQLGYAVELTPYQGDWGADLVIRKDGVKTVVQAKRWRRPVGVTAVQEVVAAKGVYGSANALVVTNSRFTDAAKTLARANGVELWNRERLIHELLAAKPALNTINTMNTISPTIGNTGVCTPLSRPIAPIPASFAPSGVPVTCARCGKPVSDGVVAYCRQRAERFGGRVYCYGHQRERERRPTPVR